MSKKVYLRPSSEGSDTSWNLAAGASKTAAVDPGDPPTHDNNTSYLLVTSPGEVEVYQSFVVGNKPTDIAAVIAVRVGSYASVNAAAQETWYYAAFGSSRGAITEVAAGGQYPDASGHPDKVLALVAVARPGGGNWSRSDIENTTLAVGTQAPDSAGFPTGNTIRLSSLWIELEYDPIPSQITPARDAMTRRLWAGWRPRSSTKLALPLHIGCDLAPLDAFPLTHPALPHPEQAGLLTKPWQRGHHYPVRISIVPGTNRVEMFSRDRRPLMCIFKDNSWSTLSSSAYAEGAGRFHPGSLRTFDRNSYAWVVDPSDELIRQIASDVEKNASGGLLIEGARTNHQVQSSFKNGTTGWTLNGTGSNGSAIAVDTTDLLFDEEVTPNSLKFTSGSPIHAADLYAQGTATATLADAIHRVAFDYKNDAAAAPLSYFIQRASDSNYWRDSDSTWQVALTWNALPGSTTKARHFTKEIDPGSATTLTVGVGVPTATGTAGQIDRLYHVQIEEGTFCTSHIVTDASTYARVADTLTMSNDLGARIWNADRGAFAFQVLPGWDAADVDAENKTAFYLQHDASNYELVKFDGTNAQWVYERKVQGVTYQATASASPVRGTVYDIVCRWTGPDGELDLTPFTLSIFVAATKGTDVVADNYGIVSVWEFEDNLLDSVGGNDLSVTAGSAAYATGLYGRAFDTQGSAILAITDASQEGLDVGAAEDLTFAIRLNLQSSPAANRTFVAKSAGGAGWTIVVRTDDKVTFTVTDGTDTVAVTSTTALTGAWYDVVFRMSRSGDALTIHVNGSLDATSASIAAVGDLSNAAAFQIGAISGALDIHFDQVSLERRAWSTEEITRYRNGGAGIKVRIFAAPTQADSCNLEYGAKGAAEFFDGQVRLIHSLQYVPFDQECKRLPPR